MSENKREMMRIIIEQENREPKVIKAEGIAFAAITEQDDETHEVNCGIVGNMGARDLLVLERAIREDLPKAIRENIVSHISDGLPALLKALFGEE